MRGGIVYQGRLAYGAEAVPLLVDEFEILPYGRICMKISSRYKVLSLIRREIQADHRKVYVPNVLMIFKLVPPNRIN